MRALLALVLSAASERLRHLATSPPSFIPHFWLSTPKEHSCSLPLLLPVLLTCLRRSAPRSAVHQKQRLVVCAPPHQVATFLLPLPGGAPLNAGASLGGRQDG